MFSDEVGTGPTINPASYQPPQAGQTPVAPGQNNGAMPNSIKPKKPFYKKWWFWVIAAVMVIAIGSRLPGGGSGNSTSSNKTTTTQGTTATTTKKDEPKAQAPAKPAEPAVPVEYKNALAKAQTYVDMMHFSKKGLYGQLTSDAGEQFPAAAAQYAIDHVKADWNANALAKAKDYQEEMNMSKKAIYDQLVSSAGEQFTASEAQYAVDHLPN